VAEPDNQPVLRLRPAADEDRFRIRRWLGQPHAEAQWGNAAAAEAEINLAIASSAALCRIIERDGIAIGYVHALDVGLLGGEPPAGLAPGTWQLSVLLASPADATPATMGTALALMAEEVFATTLAVACAGLVSIRGEAGVRAFERAGFRWQRILEDRLLGRAWLMLRERPC
jgi:aminoglycoside 6'-N-acetyltransferase